MSFYAIFPGLSNNVSTGGSNTALSNLTSPTALNQDLLPGIAGAVDAGSASDPFGAVAGLDIIVVDPALNGRATTISQTTGMAGNLSLKLPVDAGSSGDVLTTDGAGNLTWAPGGGANTTLSNLTTPTAINQDLLPATDSGINIGDNTHHVGEGFFATLLANEIHNAGTQQLYIDIANQQIKDFTTGQITIFTQGALADPANSVQTLHWVNKNLLATDGSTPVLNWSGSQLKFSNVQPLSGNTITLDADILHVGTVASQLGVLTTPATASGTGFEMNIDGGTTTDPAGVGGSVGVFGGPGPAGGGKVLIQSGNPTTSGPSGEVSITTATAGNGDTGGITVETGNSVTNNSGSILLKTGAADGARGTVQVDPGLQFNGATSGNVRVEAASVTASYAIQLPAAQGGAGETLVNDGGGILSWASGGGGGANTALSNLASTAVNASINPASDNTLSLGSPSLGWGSISSHVYYLLNSVGTIDSQFITAHNFGTGDTGDAWRAEPGVALGWDTINASIVFQIEGGTGDVKVAPGNSTGTFRILDTRTSGMGPGLRAANGSGAYIIDLPPAQGAANTSLVNNGSGILSWTDTRLTSPYQYETPSTGATVTIANTQGILIVDPAGLLATLTINMPATPIDGQVVRVCFDDFGVTALTMSGNGHTLKGALTAGVVNTGASWVYRLADDTFYRMY